MRIVVMGAGGVGGYFGARLAQSGQEVSFIARGRHLEALRSKGLTVKSPLGDAQLKVNASEEPPREADIVLFAVKLWDTESAAEKLRPMAKNALVIPFQNGVESIDRLKGILPEESIIGGAAYIAARIAAPGVIVQTGQFARLRFGPLLPSQRAATESFLKICKAASIDADLSEDIVRVIWEKFILLVGISGATALARQPLGVVRADPDLRWLLECAMRETWQLARKRGIALPEDFVAKTLAGIDKLPADMKASMAADLEAGGKLEAPWLCGAVVRMGEAHGLAAPVNRAIYAALKPYVDGSQGKAA